MSSIVYRLIRPEEVPAAFAAAGYPFAYRPAVRDAVPGVWQEWVRNQALAMHIYFRGDRIAAVSGAVFVTDEFVDAELASPRPWVKSTLVEWHLAGRRPVLLPPEMRIASHGDGLNLFLVGDAFGDMSLDIEALAEIDGYYGRTFANMFGCHLKTKWWEGHGRVRWDLGELCGMLPAAPWRDAAELEGVPAEHVPYLGRFDRSDVAVRPGTYVANLFHYRPPRFGFTYEQQSMLARALDGMTDPELAESLMISESAVKKRWQAVYHRVESIEPGLLPPGGSLQTQGAARGAERRRRLLNALRTRLEELPPELVLRIGT